MKKLKQLLAILSSVLLLTVSACTSSESEQTNSSTGSQSEQSSQEAESENNNQNANSSEGVNLEDLSFDELVEKAKGSTVTFYGWGGDEKLNQWLDEVYGPQLKEKYDITLDRVPMDIDDILSQLSNEKQAGQEEGPIDMIWINGENFKTAHENDFLYGPFADQLPNYHDYIDAEDPEHQYDFGYPIDGYESPYGKAQFAFIADSAVVKNPPTSAEELLAFAKEHPGQVTYPALPDFTGSAFVRNIIYEFVDPKEFQNMEADKEVVREAIQPAFDYLRELNPYLWKEGTTFPTDQPQLNNMFMDGELLLTMSYGAYDVAVGIENGEYPDTAQSFLFDKGTIGNTNFIAIANNSGNKAAAMVAINEMLAPDIQQSKYENLRDLPVTDYDLLDDEQKESFDQVDLGSGTIPQDELMDKRLPEMPAQLVPIIEELWLEEVVGQ